MWHSAHCAMVVVLNSNGKRTISELRFYFHGSVHCKIVTGLISPFGAPSSFMEEVSMCCHLLAALNFL